MISSSDRFGLCYLDCDILHWTFQNIKCNVDGKLGLYWSLKIPYSKFMMENMSLNVLYLYVINKLYALL